jgi:threonine/homoserine/homoserine lactone efflux protein
MLAAVLVGIALGYIGSMPVAGPIALLVLGRGLENRSRNGLSLAFGAAIAESAYAYLAFWGFGAVLARYAWVEKAARFGAAIMLVALGVHFYRRRHQASTPKPTAGKSGNKRNFMLGFAITLLNPTLIATWTFTVTTVYSLGIVSFEADKALPFSLGACSGIVGWFATLLYLLKRFRTAVTTRALERTLKAVGVVLIVVGLIIGVAATRPYVMQWFGHAPPPPPTPPSMPSPLP